MERIKAVVKKWGNSFGLILPKRIVDTEGLKEGTEIIITFEPNNKTKVKDIFGILKGKTRKSGKSTQEILEEMDEELWPTEE